MLPSTLQNLRAGGSGGQGGGGGGGPDLTSDEYLDRQEEELNRRVDVNVDQLVEGMKDLVSLAKVSPSCLWTAPGQPSLAIRSPSVAVSSSGVPVVDEERRCMYAVTPVHFAVASLACLPSSSHPTALPRLHLAMTTVS